MAHLSRVVVGDGAVDVMRHVRRADPVVKPVEDLVTSDERITIIHSIEERLEKHHPSVRRGSRGGIRVRKGSRNTSKSRAWAVDEVGR